MKQPRPSGETTDKRAGYDVYRAVLVLSLTYIRPAVARLA